MTSIINYSLSTTGSVDRLLDFINSNEFFFAIGKSTPWTNQWGDEVDDTNPPIPLASTKYITDPIIYKRAFIVNPIVESQCGNIEFESCGEVSYNNKLWTRLDQTKLSKDTLDILNPSNIYFSVSINSGDYSSPSFRIIGLYSKLSLLENVTTNKVIYLPSEVDNPGILHWIGYITPILRSTDKTTTFDLLLSI
ncbi:hypothetical protein H6G33_09255 [Calothrix sp. FACHB-1219]|uniref:hypothetical protein n=1 Tax=unclassified Calothrix TaxID=2619626 RepID=UPI001687099B|nr:MULTISPECIES: hypothetical protein [unclassified Calothrix]MBD2201532.1 hypothetical protein [Calothrix sp. FACHB-168]MBD2217218.1 hypothetical protein [Calothrix sp. FACHB-1219]